VREIALRGQLGQPGQPAPPGQPESGPAEDSALVALISGGDQGALAALYDRHAAACYRLACRVTGSATLAEDAVQDAFVGLWRTPGSYHGDRGSARAWLLALTHHKAVDLVRAEAAERRRMDARAAHLMIEPVPAGDPEAIACDDSVARQVRGALSELPQAQRDALALAYFGGYTQSQIAELTGVPVGTVKTRMYLAMRRMRRRLGPREGLLGEEAP
jgi:RNA polymerase sigma-70 factor (ECF subfamily)